MLNHLIRHIIIRQITTYAIAYSTIGPIVTISKLTIIMIVSFYSDSVQYILRDEVAHHEVSKKSDGIKSNPYKQNLLSTTY